MSNNFQNQWDDDEDFDLDDEPQAQPQRDTGNDLLKQLRKQIRQLERQKKEADAELQNYRTERRTQTVSQVLESEGVSPKIVKFIPADITEPDAIRAWLDDNSDVFGFERAPQGATNVADEAAHRKMMDVTSDALSPNVVDDIVNRIDNASSPEEVIELLAQLG